MNKADKILRDTRIILDSIRDTLEVNLVMAKQDSQLTIDDASLQRVLLLANATIEEGFQKSFNAYKRSVEEVLLSND